MIEIKVKRMQAVILYWKCSVFCRISTMKSLLYMARFYSNLKFLRYNNKLQSISNKSIVTPVNVRIKPKNHCNHNCWYCAYRADQLQLGEGMDAKDCIPKFKMMELVEDLIDMKVQAVTFSGGGEGNPFYMIVLLARNTEAP